MNRVLAVAVILAALALGAWAGDAPVAPVEWTITDRLEVCAMRDCARRRDEAFAVYRRAEADLADVTSRVMAAHGIPRHSALNMTFTEKGDLVLSLPVAPPAAPGPVALTPAQPDEAPK